jgi:hypothetical protein
MSPEKLEKLRTILFNALKKVEEKHGDVIKSSIKYCVILEPDGKLVTADWLNDHPVVKSEIEQHYEISRLLVDALPS